MVLAPVMVHVRCQSFMSWYYLATVFSCVMVSAQVILLASVMALTLVKVLAHVIWC